MKFAKLFISILFLTLISTLALAEVTNYLILEDIGPYKLFTGIPGRVFSGPPSKYSKTATGGILNASGHFSEGDVSYEASYTEPAGKWPFIKVEVTQHPGADSDRWLLHEVERGFRRGDYEEDMRPARFRNIDGNNVFYSGLGGGTYRWLSNNVVVSIEYTDLYKQKPEPIEVVKAYLSKFPSTIPNITIDRAHDEQWIKDEMERRLWLCDKWFVKLESDRSNLSSILQSIADNISVFLDYRERYFGISGKDDKVALIGYLAAKDEISIRNKPAGYKAWWNVNKTKSINLP